MKREAMQIRRRERQETSILRNQAKNATMSGTFAMLVVAARAEIKMLVTWTIDA
jgi:hypothetical protein